MKQYICDFCRQYDYPSAATRALVDAYEVISNNLDLSFQLSENIQMMKDNRFVFYAEELKRLDLISEMIGIHRFTIHLLYFILCSKYTKEQYIRNNIPIDIFHSSMLDLKWKLNETNQVYGIWGVHCGDWFRPFFQLKRFALGRLQFEVVPSFMDYDSGDHAVKKGEPVINVHIPSSGSLEYGQVLDSYARAAVFFKGKFQGQVIPFQCDSWLLYPRVNKLFPEGNIQKFTADFDVRLAGIDPRQDDRWRVFHVPNDTPIREYDETTRLQKCLKRWLLEGNQMGIGLGYFFYGANGVLQHKYTPYVGNDTQIVLF